MSRTKKLSNAVAAAIITEFLVPKAHLSLIEIVDSNAQIHRYRRNRVQYSNL